MQNGPLGVVHFPLENYMYARPNEYHHSNYFLFSYSSNRSVLLSQKFSLQSTSAVSDGSRVYAIFMHFQPFLECVLVPFPHDDVMCA